MGGPGPICKTGESLREYAATCRNADSNLTDVITTGLASATDKIVYLEGELAKLDERLALAYRTDYKAAVDSHTKDTEAWNSNLRLMVDAQTRLGNPRCLHVVENADLLDQDVESTDVTVAECARMAKELLGKMERGEHPEAPPKRSFVKPPRPSIEPIVAEIKANAYNISDREFGWACFEYQRSRRGGAPQEPPITKGDRVFNVFFTRNASNQNDPNPTVEQWCGYTQFMNVVNAREYVLKQLETLKAQPKPAGPSGVGWDL